MGDRISENGTDARRDKEVENCLLLDEGMQATSKTNRKKSVQMFDVCVCVCVFAMGGLYVGRNFM